MQNKNLPYLTRTIVKLAPKVGAKVVLEPKWGFAAQIIYKNGVVRSLRSYALDLNTIASSEIAKDKDYSKFFLKKLGYPVAPGETFFSTTWAEVIKSKKKIPHALAYAKNLGYPVIVKPNSKSRGSNVSLAHNSKELKQALRSVFKNDRVALVEKYMPGKDYRIVVLKDKIISAYERVPLSITGDGESNIQKLLKNKQEKFLKDGRDTIINFNDIRIKNKLKQKKLNPSSVLKKREKIYLLDNANLSTGGESIDMTEKIHTGFKRIVRDITKKMGLTIAGVDLMLTEGDVTLDPSKAKYYVIEINSAPGLDHYVAKGKKQKKIVEDMYLKVLRTLGKKG